MMAIITRHDEFAQKRLVVFEGDLPKRSTPQLLDPIDHRLSVRTMTWRRVK
jgi:hypothetical protein